MDIKPPAMIAIIVAVLVLIGGAYMMYDRHQKEAMSAGPTITKEQYMHKTTP